VSLFFYSISANITSSNSPITATLDNGTFPFLDFGSTVPVFTVSTFDNTTNLGIGIMEFKTVLGVSTVTIWKQVSGGIRGGFVNSGGVQTGGIDPICITYPDTP
jgi:hypothetical protein